MSDDNKRETFSPVGYVVGMVLTLVFAIWVIGVNGKTMLNQGVELIAKRDEIRSINKDLLRTQICLNDEHVHNMEQCDEYWYNRDKNEIVIYRQIGVKE